MRDIHNHLLYGIDDGAKTIEDSERLLKELEKNNVTDIMFTPHYIIGSNYNANNAKKKKLLNELKKLLPEMMSVQEIETHVDYIISKNFDGMPTKKDMGKIIKMFKESYSNADGAVLANVVKSRIFV